jgi:hypothetical protein
MTSPSIAKKALLDFGAVAVVEREVTIPAAKSGGPDSTLSMNFRELTGDGLGVFSELTGSEATFSAGTMVEILMLTLCEADGTRQFTTEEDQVELIGMKFTALNAIFLVAMQVIGLTAESVEVKKES